MADGDPFDDLFGLEEKYYDEGFKQGLIDGSKQSQLSARLFGIEKGFEKFVALGQLQAKANMWAARMRPHSTAGSDGLPPLPANDRTLKHLDTLLALVDPKTISFANTDEAVSEFDDRVKRAHAKVKVIERIIGPDPLFSGADTKKAASNPPRPTGIANMEDFGS